MNSFSKEVDWNHYSESNLEIDHGIQLLSSSLDKDIHLRNNIHIFFELQYDMPRLHRCWRRNVLVTTIRCWWQFWLSRSPTSIDNFSLVDKMKNRLDWKVGCLDFLDSCTLVNFSQTWKIFNWPFWAPRTIFGPIISDRTTIGDLSLISRQDISVRPAVLTVWVDKNDHPPFFHWIFDSLGPRILHRKPYKNQQNLKTAFFVFWHEWNWFSWDSEADCDWLINNEKGSKIGFVFILSLYSKPTKGRLIRLKYLSLENRTLRNRLWKSPILGVRIVRNDSE